MADRFAPFAHLPLAVRQKAIRHVRMMRQIGLELTAVDTKMVNGFENYVLYFGKDNDVIVNLTVDRDESGPD